MTHLRLLPLVLTLWAVSFADDAGNKPSTTKPPALKSASSISGSNVTEEAHRSNTTANTKMGFNLDGAMVNRALYVLIGITAIGVLYFLVRAVRLQKHQLHMRWKNSMDVEFEERLCEEVRPYRRPYNPLIKRYKDN